MQGVLHKGFDILRVEGEARGGARKQVRAGRRRAGGTDVGTAKTEESESM